MRVFVEQFPNKDLRDFHLEVPVAAKPFSRYDPNKKVPKKVLRLERKLQNLPCIADDMIGDIVSRKAIRVKINKAFTWPEVITEVTKVISDYFKKEIQLTIAPREEWMDRPEREEIY